MLEVSLSGVETEEMRGQWSNDLRHATNEYVSPPLRFSCYTCTDPGGDLISLKHSHVVKKKKKKRKRNPIEEMIPR